MNWRSEKPLGAYADQHLQLLKRYPEYLRRRTHLDADKCHWVFFRIAHRENLSSLADSHIMYLRSASRNILPAHTAGRSTRHGQQARKADSGKEEKKVQQDVRHVERVGMGSSTVPSQFHARAVGEVPERQVLSKPLPTKLDRGTQEVLPPSPFTITVCTKVCFVLLASNPPLSPSFLSSF